MAYNHPNQAMTTPQENSRRLAQQWPYPRHKDFVRTLRNASTKWFEQNGFPTHPKMKYCLDSWENWRRNIILEEVYDYIA